MAIRIRNPPDFFINHQESESAISDSDSNFFKYLNFKIRIIYLNGRYSKLVHMTNIYIKILAFYCHNDIKLGMMIPDTFR